MSEENTAPKNKTHMWARRKARRALAQAAYCLLYTSDAADE